MRTQGEVKHVGPNAPSRARKINKDPNLAAGKRSDNALDDKPRTTRKPGREPVVIEKTP